MAETGGCEAISNVSGTACQTESVAATIIFSFTPPVDATVVACDWPVIPGQADLAYITSTKGRFASYAERQLIQLFGLWEYVPGA